MKHKRLSLEEREEIKVSLSHGLSFRCVAKKLGRSHSTITREVQRFGKGRDGYSAVKAEKKAKERNLNSGRKKLIYTNPDLFQEVFSRLFDYWSPQQISENLKNSFPDEPWMWISHETIYKHVYAFPRGQLKKVMISFLRQKKRLRGGKGKSSMRRQVIPDPIPLSERPKEALDRQVPGHWEGDLVMGKGNKSAIGTLVERKTRMVFLVPLRAKNAKTVADSFAEIFNEISPEIKKSLAYDRGTEMAEHKTFTASTGIPVYFADPHAPWQRGSCENTNGLIRDFFPKGTDFHKVSKEELKKVQNLLNDRPRKTLDWKTPREMFYESLGATVN